MPAPYIKKESAPRRTIQLGALMFGVTDGARTRDTQDHNLVLYQLNYSHHYCFTVLSERCAAV